MKGFTETSFINDCINGSAKINDLDDYVEYWHKNNTGVALHDYLGFTDEEYGKWIKTGDDVFIAEILRDRIRRAGVGDDKYYYIFVLGYDLLRDRLINSDDSACDTSFERCKLVYQRFLESGYDGELYKPTYENLKEFIEDTTFEFESATVKKD